MPSVGGTCRAGVAPYLQGGRGNARDISGADARRVMGLTRELRDAACAEELWGRALTAAMTLVPADADRRYRLSADREGVSAFLAARGFLHADPMVIYYHPLDDAVTYARRRGGGRPSPGRTSPAGPLVRARPPLLAVTGWLPSRPRPPWTRSPRAGPTRA
jgi:hypothetical protein